jgi:hypothetical protein
MLRQDDFQKSKLAEVGWQHGREYGGHLASCMIMSVLANRVRKGWGNWIQVIDRIPKFAAIKEMPTGSPEIWEPEFVRLLHEVDAIFDGTKNYAQSKGHDGSMTDALYWCDTRFIETDYFKENILGQKERHPRVMDMNTLVLFQ